MAALTLKEQARRVEIVRDMLKILLAPAPGSGALPVLPSREFFCKNAPEERQRNVSWMQELLKRLRQMSRLHLRIINGTHHYSIPKEYIAEMYAVSLNKDAIAQLIWPRPKMDPADSAAARADVARDDDAADDAADNDDDAADDNTSATATAAKPAAARAALTGALPVGPVQPTEAVPDIDGNPQTLTELVQSYARLHYLLMRNLVVVRQQSETAHQKLEAVTKKLDEALERLQRLEFLEEMNQSKSNKSQTRAS